MPLPDRAGTFLAKPLKWKVEEVGANKLATFVCQWALTAVKHAGEWCEFDAEITSYSFITKKDGNLNERAINDLRDVFGWNGRSIEELHDGDWSGVEASLAIEYETGDDGRQRLKVKWINRTDHEGGWKAPEPAAIKTIASGLNARLRAMAPAGPAPAKPAGRPAPPPAPPSKRPPPSAPPADEPAPDPKYAEITDKDTCWDYFSTIFNDNVPDGAWFDAIAKAEAVSKRKQADFTAADWRLVAKEAVPF